MSPCTCVGFPGATSHRALSGSISFEELVTQQAVYPTFRHGKGIKVERDQLEFLDGSGLNTLAEWSRMVGNEIAYVPQRLVAQMILNGGNTDGSANAYDGCPFFVSPVRSYMRSAMRMYGDSPLENRAMTHSSPASQFKTRHSICAKSIITN